jgi:pimeloyl-ACP methyl ester carboxylesterase
MAALDASLALYAFDTPCNGGSCAPASAAPPMGAFADMIARGADALGLQRIVLYGTHTGAHIAVEWALSRCDQVRAVVLDGVALLDEATRTEFLERYAPPQTCDENGTQFVWAWNFIRDQMLFFPHYKKDAAHLRTGGTLDPAILHDLTMDVLANLQTYHLPYEAVFRHDIEARLRALAVPVLVMCDSESALDQVSPMVTQLVPHAMLAPDCATPAAKARAIERFLKGCPA